MTADVKVYRYEILIRDHDNMSQKDIEALIGDIEYVSAKPIKLCQVVEIEEWDDDHLLNWNATTGEQISKWFEENKKPAA